MKKLLLYALLAAGSLSSLALYAAHEQELSGPEEQEIEFDAESELVPCVSDYEKYERAIRQVFPFERIPLRLVMQYADNCFYVDPYYNSVNFGDDAELDPAYNPEQEMRYATDTTKRAFQQLATQILSLKDSLQPIEEDFLNSLLPYRLNVPLTAQLEQLLPARVIPLLKKVIKKRPALTCEKPEQEDEFVFVD
jgi:hypothetical protein